MKKGDLISVDGFKDGVLQQRIVEISGDTFYICTEQEWETAKAERREPQSVGFNRCFVLFKMNTVKVHKAKFDDLLGKLLKAKLLPEKKVKAQKKRSPNPIMGTKPQKG